MKREIYLPSLKQVWTFLMGIMLLALVAVSILFVWHRYQTNPGGPVQIIPWSLTEDSPYVCFAAIRGENELLALSCLPKKE